MASLEQTTEAIKQDFKMATLKQVKEAITAKDKARIFKTTYEQFKPFDDNSLFADYIKFIYDNQKKWMNESYNEWDSITTIKKQYNVLLLDLFNHPDIGKTIDENIKKELKTNLPKIVKQLTKEGRFKPAKASQKEAKVAPHEADSGTEEEYEDQHVPDAPKVVAHESTPDSQELLEENKLQKQDIDRYSSLFAKYDAERANMKAMLQFLADYTEVMDDKAKALQVVKAHVFSFMPL